MTLWRLSFLCKKTLWRLSLFDVCRWCWWWCCDVCCWEKTTACVVTFVTFVEPTGVFRDAEHNGDVRNFGTLFAHQTGCDSISLIYPHRFHGQGSSGCRIQWWSRKCCHFLFREQNREWQHFLPFIDSLLRPRTFKKLLAQTILLSDSKFKYRYIQVKFIICLIIMMWVSQQKEWVVTVISTVLNLYIYSLVYYMRREESNWPPIEYWYTYLLTTEWYYPHTRHLQGHLWQLHKKNHVHLEFTKNPADPKRMQTGMMVKVICSPILCTKQQTWISAECDNSPAEGFQATHFVSSTSTNYHFFSFPA